MSFLERYLGGHLSVGRLTIYGLNAMHVAFTFRTKRWGYLCFHPPIRIRGYWWSWYFYISPNATPWASTFAIGPGVNFEDRAYAIIRRNIYGHNFNTDLLSGLDRHLKAIPK